MLFPSTPSFFHVPVQCWASSSSEDGGVIVWGFTDYLHGLSDKVMHPEKVAGNFTLDGCKSAERWWFA